MKVIQNGKILAKPFYFWVYSLEGGYSGTAFESHLAACFIPGSSMGAWQFACLVFHAWRGSGFRVYRV